MPPSRNDSIVISSEKNAVCAPEYGKEAISAKAAAHAAAA
jgi:hypothetical protein